MEFSDNSIIRSASPIDTTGLGFFVYPGVHLTFEAPSVHMKRGTVRTTWSLVRTEGCILWRLIKHLLAAAVVVPYLCCCRSRREKASGMGRAVGMLVYLVDLRCVNSQLTFR